MENILKNHIEKLNNKLQLLLKNYLVLQKENEILKKTVLKSVESEKLLKTTIDSLEQKILILQASVTKMNEADKKQFEKRIDQYIKDIDKCINALSK